MLVFSEDVFLQVLDRDPALVFSELASRDTSEVDLEAVAVLLSYGAALPPGRQWGRLEDRRDWRMAERAKRIRQQAVQVLIEKIQDDATLMRVLRAVRKRRGRGPLLKALVRGWHERNEVNTMELS